MSEAQRCWMGVTCWDSAPPRQRVVNSTCGNCRHWSPAPMSMTAPAEAPGIGFCGRDENEWEEQLEETPGCEWHELNDAPSREGS